MDRLSSDFLTIWPKTGVYLLWSADIDMMKNSEMKENKELFDKIEALFQIHHPNDDIELLGDKSADLNNKIQNEWTEEQIKEASINHNSLFSEKQNKLDQYIHEKIGLNPEIGKLISIYYRKTF